MSETGSLSVECLLSISVVAVLWGATNPFLRRGVRSSNEAPPFLDPNTHFLLQPLVRLLNLILNWKVFLPLAINQSASVLFVAVTASYPISLVVPVVNSLQLIVTTVVGAMLGEKLTPKSLLGCLLIGMGITLMLIDENRAS
ncbi:hypothetical protein PFISCL1PPCAC_19398 [Pristionchus fissidentatus]|uniref:Transmembrane protein 234 n=1 Tax=Pristionchus fissidentatus TaxID=1538716 RepID=A0AAV5WBC9_9BILA|nr:hypothetical protein PFISCL1PPCAC_19398 [Pristionchus fissidentatus]